MAQDVKSFMANQGKLVKEDMIKFLLADLGPSEGRRVIGDAGFEAVASDAAEPPPQTKEAVLDWVKNQEPDVIEELLKTAALRYDEELGYKNFFERGREYRLTLEARDDTKHEVSFQVESVSKNRVVLVRDLDAPKKKRRRRRPGSNTDLDRLPGTWAGTQAGTHAPDPRKALF